MKPKGFLQTLMSVCSGTEDFPVLIQESPIQTILNIFILALICAVFNVSVGLYPFYKSYISTCKQLEKKFGGIQFNEKGIVPEKFLEKQNCVVNDEDFRIDYIPNLDVLKTYKPKKEYNSGIVWTPQAILYWVRLMEDDDKLMILPLMLPVTNLYTSNDLSAILKKVENVDDSPSFYSLAEIYKIAPKEAEDRLSISFYNFTSNILLWIPLTIPALYTVFLFSSIILNIIFVSMLYLLFFTVFIYFLGRGSNLGLTFSEIWKATVYTSFPGFIIATIYTALKLPYLDFQTIFLISYFIYYFAVFSRLKKTYTSNL